MITGLPKLPGFDFKQADGSYDLPTPTPLPTPPQDPLAALSVHDGFVYRVDQLRQAARDAVDAYATELAAWHTALGKPCEWTPTPLYAPSDEQGEMYRVMLQGHGWAYDAYCALVEKYAAEHQS